MVYGDEEATKRQNEALANASAQMQRKDGDESTLEVQNHLKLDSQADKVTAELEENKDHDQEKQGQVALRGENT